MSLLYKVRNKIQSVKNRLRQSPHGGFRPTYPKNGDGGLKIHLGAGPVNLQGWVNIDARQAPHIHLQSEGFALSEFADGAISEIYMCHVLEHFSFEEIKEIVLNLRKKLRVGGVLRISVPDLDRLIAVYQANGNDLELIKYALMGGQDYAHNFHKAVFNHGSLAAILTACGFVSVDSWETYDEFGVHIGDWSETGFSTPKGDFPISLNLKGVKSHA